MIAARTAPPISVRGTKPAPFGSFIVRGQLPPGMLRKCFPVPANDGDLRKWQRRVKLAATNHALGYQQAMITGPAVVRAVFFLPRPPYHYVAGALKSDAPRFPIEKRKDDLDKFVRALFDAVTGVLVDDDARIVDMHVKKRYAREPSRIGVAFDVRRVVRR